MQSGSKMFKQYITGSLPDAGDTRSDVAEVGAPKRPHYTEINSRDQSGDHDGRGCLVV